ncbi:DNA-binding transcriptional regulator GbsR (MarR family) [Actinokineospora baliensis]|uniref:GbsR/MarR family transcriptional regulator n=1 Tax=Actinokineospora baliensis TaxID=547056 RepID=UPI0027DD0186|nr:MarR family transcriptional regulator [Actinokineospora baliensis]MBM7771298.1 DNA-binding transcriptional regulator GbsR (MarR family) [Actinokineospora baliensis]
MTDDPVAHYVERFALLLSDAGMPRMPARVFTRLLVNDSGKASATELAQALQVSPAAISGAVRYLEHVGMITRGRDPGQRRDHYAVPDDAWYEAIMNRDKVLSAWSSAMADGAKLLGEDSPAGKRMATSNRFFEFLRQEMDEMLDRWRAQR